MLIRGATPDGVTRRPASFSVPVKSEPKPARAAWTPSKHGWVIAQCGHICADDEEIVALGAILKTFKGVKVYCAQCGEFIKAVKRTTPLEALGFVPLPLGDDPPF